jgi:pyrroloquinoline quinone (PQQ) biosynthesis protein C
MIDRKQFEGWYKTLHQQFSSHPEYEKIAKRQITKTEALALVQRVCKAHLRSPQILGFLYAIVSPSSREHLEHNLLEELGREHDGEPSHPDLLRRLGDAIGLGQKEWHALEVSAEQVLRNKASEPLMFGTLVETGLNIMLEVFAFEWVLARESRKMGEAIQEILSLETKALEWFYHHSEVDIAHAEQGLDTLVEYVRYYQLDDDSVKTIAEITFRDNIFLKRYLDLQIEAPSMKAL